MLVFINTFKENGFSQTRPRAFAYRWGALSIRIVLMETRKERYAKYREQIRHMRDGEFPKPSSEEGVSNASNGGATVSEQSGAMMPYALYLRHRRRMLAFKVFAFVLAVAGFVVWWFLMQGR